MREFLAIYTNTATHCQITLKALALQFILVVMAAVHFARACQYEACAHAPGTTRECKMIAPNMLMVQWIFPSSMLWLWLDGQHIWLYSCACVSTSVYVWYTCKITWCLNKCRRLSVLCKLRNFCVWKHDFVPVHDLVCMLPLNLTLCCIYVNLQLPAFIGGSYTLAQVPKPSTWHGRSATSNPTLFFNPKFWSTCMCFVCTMQPSNMLLNSDCLVKVCDFGLARSISSVCLSLSPSLSLPPRTSLCNTSIVCVFMSLHNNPWAIFFCLRVC